MKTHPRNPLLDVDDCPLRVLACVVSFAALVSIPIILTGCAGQAAANAITAASETAAAAVIQNKTVTLAQLSSLSKDLPGVASGVPLTAQDNAAIAQVLATLVHQRATLTSASAVDAINTAIASLNAAQSPTAAQGLVWANLSDVAIGFKQEVAFAQANPQLMPQ